MRSLLWLLFALPLLTTSPTAAVTIDWVTVGNPGNVADTRPNYDGISGYGSVGYIYQLSKYEITNTQYAEFLNAIADTDLNELYSTSMASGFGGITRSGISGSYSYSVIAGRGDMPVNYVSFYDAIRFANWLQNGQPSGPQDITTTDGGAYTITAQGVADNSIIRNTEATIVLPTQDEWYKAAFYHAMSESYFDFPTASGALPTCAPPTTAPSSANCDDFGSDEFDADIDDLSPVGSYPGSPGPSGAFDLDGNVSEWTEEIRAPSGRSSPGANFLSVADANYYRYHLGWYADRGEINLGFRVAMIPEPSTGLLVITGLLSLVVWRRSRF